MVNRPCPECGSDASTCEPTAVPQLVRENAAAWVALEADGVVQPGRQDPDRWSSLEYACHVRDVYRRFDERIQMMLTEDNPLFPNWDQDVTAVEDRYEEQDSETVISELRSAALAIADRLDQVAGDDWERPGRRSDGSSFTVATITQYMIHDPIHHIWDVTG